MATDFFTSIGGAGYAKRVEKSSVAVLMPHGGAGSQPELKVDDGLGAMRGLAAALIVYLFVAVLGLTALLVWHFAR